jgi:phosphoglycolate phosphatase-like HAD superfamily hydrolase
MRIFGTDFDGVIINIEPQKSAAFADLVNAEWGIDRDAAYECWRDFAGTSRRFKFDYFYEKKFNKKLDNSTYQLIEPKLSNLLTTDYYPTVELLPGALELLEFVSKNFDYAFVSSGVPMMEIKYLIELLHLSKYFDQVLGTNNIYTSKKIHFEKILDERKPDQLVFLGDGKEDMRVAKEFHAIAIGMTTNNISQELLSAGADKIVANNFEALSVIKSL